MNNVKLIQQRKKISVAWSLAFDPVAPCVLRTFHGSRSCQKLSDSNIPSIRSTHSPSPSRSIRLINSAIWTSSSRIFSRLTEWLISSAVIVPSRLRSICIELCDSWLKINRTCMNKSTRRSFLAVTYSSITSIGSARNGCVRLKMALIAFSRFSNDCNRRLQMIETDIILKQWSTNFS